MNILYGIKAPVRNQMSHIPTQSRANQIMTSLCFRHSARLQLIGMHRDTDVVIKLKQNSKINTPGFFIVVHGFIISPVFMIDIYQTPIVIQGI